MHSLEHLLNILSKRIKDETGNEELADAAKFLASESNKYNTEGFTEGEEIRDMGKRWSEEHPLH